MLPFSRKKVYGDEFRRSGIQWQAEELDKLKKCSKLATIGQAPAAVIQIKLHEYSDSRLHPLDLSSKSSHMTLVHWVTHASVSYRRLCAVECTNLLWTDLA
jgi:hypothetical protein